MTRVTAIIVTYNRKQLLLRCLAAFNRQTLRPTRILLVDNGSTDGTAEALQAAGWLSRPDVQLLRLEHNLGGAGGFSEGWKQALAGGAEWLWSMDDDGYPADDCLKQLLQVATQRDLAAISPVQADIENASLPAFPTFDARGKPITRYPYSSPDGDFLIPRHANLFNGLLIKADAVRRIGLPRAELFIRGDEVEYTRRMIRQGVHFGTLTTAYFYHPSDRRERHRFLFGIGFARDANDDFKNYYMYRNKGLAFRENGWLWMLPFDAARYIYYFLIQKRWDTHGLGVWVRAMRDGLMGRLGKHPRY